MQQRRQSSLLSQILINFALPIIVLTKFSGDDQLGPTWGLVVALAFPVVYELTNIIRTRKVSYLSLAAIGGILVTGAIGLLGLSEQWLAVRRSIIYFFGAIVIVISARMNRSIIALLLKQVINLDLAAKHAARNHQQRALERLISGCTYAVAAVAGGAGVLSYLLTRHTINAPTNSTLFNEQLAALRVQSIFAVTVPLLVGMVIILTYAITRIEKLSGLPSEELMHKKPTGK